MDRPVQILTLIILGTIAIMAQVTGNDIGGVLTVVPAAILGASFVVNSLKPPKDHK